MSNQVELSIVVPLYNESSLLTELHERLSKAASLVSSNFELVFVNDGSKDKTFEQLKLLASQFPEVRFINLSRNFGHQIAVSAGLDNCLGKAVVIIDGDLQDPPEIIPELYKKNTKKAMKWSMPDEENEKEKRYSRNLQQDYFTES